MLRICLDLVLHALLRIQIHNFIILTVLYCVTTCDSVLYHVTHVLVKTELQVGDGLV